MKLKGREVRMALGYISGAPIQKDIVMTLASYRSFPRVRECIRRPNTRFIGIEIIKSTMDIHNISGTTLSQRTMGPE